MPTRIAATLSLVAFATCLVLGMVAENSFTTIILRALGAMIVTLVLGLVLGAMGQKMIDENLSQSQKKSEIPESKAVEKDR
jgi:TctA family transporter